jgi:hypothetical protein
MGIKFTNNAEGALASGITAGATTLTLGSGEGDLFPAVSGSDFFYATIIDVSGNREIIKCTSRTAASNVFTTIVRAQDNTAARAFSAGDKVQLRVTAAVLTQWEADMALAHNQNTDVGTSSNIFQLGTVGPNIKNNSSVVELKNAGDTAFASLKAHGLTLADALIIAGTITGVTNLTASGIITADDLVAGSSAVVSRTGSQLTLTGTMQAEHIISTDDCTIQDNLEVLGDLNVSGSIAGQIDNVATSDLIRARDHGTASVDEVVNVCYGTGATPPSYTTVTEGTLYFQYTP